MAKHCLILTLLAGLALARVYNVDELTEVDLEVDGEVLLSLTSKPSTGYSWFLNPPNSPYIEVRGMLTGDYHASSSGVVGASGTQTFHLGCTSLCVEGGQAEVLFTYQRPWEKEPVQSKRIKLNIVAKSAPIGSA